MVFDPNDSPLDDNELYKRLREAATDPDFMEYTANALNSAGDYVSTLEESDLDQALAENGLTLAGLSVLINRVFEPGQGGQLAGLQEKALVLQFLVVSAYLLGRNYKPLDFGTWEDALKGVELP